MKKVSIRKATVNDLSVLLQFEQGIILAERPFNPTLKDDPVNYYDLEEMLNDAQIDVVVADLDGELVACGYSRIERSKHFLKHEHHAYFGMMYVLPEHRGKGINALIMEELKRLARSRGINEVRLEVFSLNQSAIKAYEKIGFEHHLIEMRLAI